MLVTVDALLMIVAGVVVIICGRGNPTIWMTVNCESTGYDVLMLEFGHQDFPANKNKVLLIYRKIEFDCTMVLKRPFSTLHNAISSMSPITS
jgi:hypothetical protein